MQFIRVFCIYLYVCSMPVTVAARSKAWNGFVVDKAALGQVFSEYCGFPCQSFHQYLHHHNYPGAGAIGNWWPQCWVDPIGLHLPPIIPIETTKHSNIGIVGSNLIRGTDICVYSVFVLSCIGSGLATGWSRIQRVLPTVCKIQILELINPEWLEVTEPNASRQKKISSSSSSSSSSSCGGGGGSNTYLLTYGAEPFLRSCQLCSHSENSQQF
jgi:hypothetical protein